MTIPVSNPLGQLHQRQAGVISTAEYRYRVQRARTLWSLAILLVAACLLVTGSSLAWGWPGALIAAGSSFGVVGTLIGLTSAVPD